MALRYSKPPARRIHKVGAGAAEASSWSLSSPRSIARGRTDPLLFCASRRGVLATGQMSDLVTRRQHSPVMCDDEHQAVGIRRPGAGNGWGAGNRIGNGGAAGAREAMQVSVGER